MWKNIKEHKTKSAVIAVSIILGLWLVLWLLFFSKQVATVPKITESKARLGNIAVTVDNDGVLQAKKVVLNFSQIGTLQTLNVEVGDTVAVGDIIASQDSTKISAQVNQAQATYSANLSKASRLLPGGEEVSAKQIAVNAFRVALNAEKAIYNDVVSKYGVGSTQELAEAAKLTKAQSDIESAEAQLAITTASYSDANYSAISSYANVEAIKASLYDTQISAPMSGIVTSVNGAVGQSVGGSQTSQSGFITIVDPSTIVLVSQFDEEDITKISVGQKIKAEFTAINETLEGEVSYVSPVSVVDQNAAVTYEVRSTLSLNGRKLLDGMSATVGFVTKEVKDVVVIPNKAIKRIDGKSLVSYYDENKKIITKSVITGFTDGKSVEITKGLDVGDGYVIIE